MHIVAVMHEPPPMPAEVLAALHADRHHVAVRDDNEARLAPFFGASNTTIEDWLHGGRNVLVHCSSGISRSAAVALAYVVGVARQPLRKAYTEMRERRPCICPGTTFFVDLQELEVAVAMAVEAGDLSAPAPQPPQQPQPPQPSMSLGEYYAHTVQHNAVMMGGGAVTFNACVTAVERFGFATDYALLQAIEHVVASL